MPVLTSQGFEFQGSIDQIGNLSSPNSDARASWWSLAAANADVTMDLNGKAVAIFDIRATANSATYVFEGSLDGVNYYGLPALSLLAETMTAAVVVTTTHGASYIVTCSGLRRVRCRVSAHTSGSAIVTARASEADFAIYNRPIPSTLFVTSTAAANTAATATLPAAPGLFHYITNIHCTRNATAALAGTATLIITSTNLPGNAAWSNGNAMIAGGSQLDLNLSPTTPIKSLASNTATTIVMPAAGLAVLNRVNVSYYVGA